MQLRPHLTSYLVLALVAAGLSPARAESSAEAREWLDKVVALYQGGSFTVDYTATIDLSPMGQAIRGDLSGHMTYGDRDHRRLEMRMSLSGLPGDGGDAQAPMEMEMLSVSDGEVVWTEVDMKALGGRQVMKLAQDEVEKLAAAQGMGGFAANPSSMDPVAQVETLTGNLDFELAGIADGKVSLTGTLAVENRESLGQLGALGVDSFLLVLDKATGFPIEMAGSAGGERVVRMLFENLEKVDRASLPEGIFEYRPPAGVPVLDLASMLGAAD